MSDDQKKLNETIMNLELNKKLNEIAQLKKILLEKNEGKNKTENEVFELKKQIEGLQVDLDLLSERIQEIELNNKEDEKNYKATLDAATKRKSAIQNELQTLEKDKMLLENQLAESNKMKSTLDATIAEAINKSLKRVQSSNQIAVLKAMDDVIIPLRKDVSIVVELDKSIQDNEKRIQNASEKLNKALEKDLVGQKLKELEEYYPVLIRMMHPNDQTGYEGRHALIPVGQYGLKWVAKNVLAEYTLKTGPHKTDINIDTIKILTEWSENEPIILSDKSDPKIKTAIEVAYDVWSRTAEKHFKKNKEADDLRGALKALREKQDSMRKKFHELISKEDLITREGKLKAAEKRKSDLATQSMNIEDPVIKKSQDELAKLAEKIKKLTSDKDSLLKQEKILHESLNKIEEPKPIKHQITESNEMEFEKKQKELRSLQETASKKADDISLITPEINKLENEIADLELIVNAAKTHEMARKVQEEIAPFLGFVDDLNGNIFTRNDVNNANNAVSLLKLNNQKNTDAFLKTWSLDLKKKLTALYLEDNNSTQRAHLLKELQDHINSLNNKLEPHLQVDSPVNLDKAYEDPSKKILSDVTGLIARKLDAFLKGNAPKISDEETIEKIDTWRRQREEFFAKQTVQALFASKIELVNNLYASANNLSNLLLRKDIIDFDTLEKFEKYSNIVGKYRAAWLGLYKTALQKYIDDPIYIKLVATELENFRLELQKELDPNDEAGQKILKDFCDTLQQDIDLITKFHSENGAIPIVDMHQGKLAEWNKIRTDYSKQHEEKWLDEILNSKIPKASEKEGESMVVEMPVAQEKIMDELEPQRIKEAEGLSPQFSGLKTAQDYTQEQVQWVVNENQELHKRIVDQNEQILALDKRIAAQQNEVDGLSKGSKSLAEERSLLLEALKASNDKVADFEQKNAREMEKARATVEETTAKLIESNKKREEEHVIELAAAQTAMKAAEAAVKALEDKSTKELEAQRQAIAAEQEKTAAAVLAITEAEKQQAAANQKAIDEANAATLKAEQDLEKERQSAATAKEVAAAALVVQTKAFEEQMNRAKLENEQVVKKALADAQKTATEREAAILAKEREDSAARLKAQEELLKTQDEHFRAELVRIEALRRNAEAKREADLKVANDGIEQQRRQLAAENQRLVADNQRLQNLETENRRLQALLANQQQPQQQQPQQPLEQQGLAPPAPAPEPQPQPQPEPGPGPLIPEVGLKMEMDAAPGLGAEPDDQEENQDNLEFAQAERQNVQLGRGQGPQAGGIFDMFDIVKKRATKIGQKSKDKKDEAPSPAIDDGAWNNYVKKMHDTIHKKAHINIRGKTEKELQDLFQKRKKEVGDQYQYNEEQWKENLENKIDLYQGWQVATEPETADMSFQIQNENANTHEIMTKATVSRNKANNSIEFVAEDARPDDVTILLMLEHAREVAKRTGKWIIKVSDCAGIPEQARKLAILAIEMKLTPQFDEVSKQALDKYLVDNPGLERPRFPDNEPRPNNNNLRFRGRGH